MLLHERFSFLSFCGNSGPTDIWHRCVTLCLPFTLDSMCNGTPTLAPLSFFASVSRFYGTASWYYYLHQALPLLARPALPLVLQAIFV